ncbi:hypothetical protein GCM10009665_42220 [Kitasatospora nipponensis]|uniref:Uncharacterized protein n=1 Tax=Kitasatospora nipponensis TaxID=258049 RepID=A0ABN1WDC2_9ACTN
MTCGGKVGGSKLTGLAGAVRGRGPGTIKTGTGEGMAMRSGDVVIGETYIASIPQRLPHQPRRPVIGIFEFSTSVIRGRSSSFGEPGARPHNSSGLVF